MRRILSFITALLILSVLTVGVSAATQITTAGAYCTVSATGSCQVTLTMTVHLDKVEEDLAFPLPGSASSVTVNGSRVHTGNAGGNRTVNLYDLFGNVTGEFSLTVTYILPDVLAENSVGVREVQIPLLSGFAYPVSSLEFSVSLPGEITAKPAFESGYHQTNIERDITYEIQGTTVSGRTSAELKDHETLTFRLTADDNVFPRERTVTRDYTFAVIGMYICGAAALAYWILTLRFWPLRKRRNTQPPEGFTAGDVPCILNLQGVDLHTMVLTWAQLGYLEICTQPGGKVVLYQRMEMGNERTEPERQVFRKLFAKGGAVDTDKRGYALLCRAVARNPGNIRELAHRHSGNAKVFRAIAAGMGLFGGICVAIAASGGALLQGLLIVVMAILGIASGWYVQGFGRCLLSPHRSRVGFYLAVCALWLLLGLLAGVFAELLRMVIFLLIAGILLCWGGRRTDRGRELAAQVMGLRQYLRRLDKETLRQICENDPDYFFALAPYAIALGVDKSYARRFGGMRFDSCPYLNAEKEPRLTAMQWMERLQKVLNRMDARAKQLPFERLLAFIRRGRR